MKANDLEKSGRMGRENSALKILIQVLFFPQNKILIVKYILFSPLYLLHTSLHDFGVGSARHDIMK